MDLKSKPFKLLTRLNDLSDEINTVQNSIRSTDQLLNETHEQDKKAALDYRLKFGVKIEEANKSLTVQQEIENINQQQSEAQQKLKSLNDDLYAYLTENAPDHQSCYKVKQLREEINNVKLEVKLLTVKLKESEQIHAKFTKKYRDSIHKTRAYFEFKSESMQRIEVLLNRLNELKRSIIRLREEYSQNLNELEKISSDIHEQRKLEANRHQIIDPLLDLRVSSISQYSIDDSNWSNNCKSPSMNSLPPIKDKNQSNSNSPKMINSYSSNHSPAKTNLAHDQNDLIAEDDDFREDCNNNSQKNWHPLL